MSPEKELLQRIFNHVENLPPRIHYAIVQLLGQPEPFTPDWVNYRQGVEDSKREPLSEDEILKGIKAERPISRSAFTLGVKFGEKTHGIGK